MLKPTTEKPVASRRIEHLIYRIGDSSGSLLGFHTFGMPSASGRSFPVFDPFWSVPDCFGFILDRIRPV